MGFFWKYLQNYAKSGKTIYGIGFYRKQSRAFEPYYRYFYAPFRFTIVIRCIPENIDKIVKQLEKQVEVLKSFYYEDKDVIFQEMALYKMPPTAFSENGGMLEHLVRRYNARILSIEPEFIVIEKTGHEDETQALLDELRPYGILSFVRSGRIAIAKPMKRLSVHLEELEAVTVYD